MQITCQDPALGDSSEQDRYASMELNLFKEIYTVRCGKSQGSRGEKELMLVHFWSPLGTVCSFGWSTAVQEEAPPRVPLPALRGLPNPRLPECQSIFSPCGWGGLPAPPWPCAWLPAAATVKGRVCKANLSCLLPLCQKVN